MTSALIVVDVQVDFCEGGALAVEGGNQVAAEIADYLGQVAFDYRALFFSQDWHNDPIRDPSGNCGHFALPPREPDYVDSWPVHCVAESQGAYFHPAIESWLMQSTRYPGRTVSLVRKGQGVPAYSAFDGSIAQSDGQRWTGATLLSVLKALDVDQIDVMGLAYDHCVAATAIAGAKAGLRAEVYSKLSRPVSIHTAEQADERMKQAGVRIV